MDISELPKAEDLNKDDSEYVQKLDAGFIQVNDYWLSLNQEKNRFLLTHSTSFFDYLVKKGLSVKTSIPVTRKDLVYAVDSKQGEYRITHEIFFNPLDGEEFSDPENLIKDFEKNRDSEYNSIFDRLRDLGKVRDGYLEAFLSLTDYMLELIDPQYQTAHFFAVRPSGVYESHVRVPEVNISQKNFSFVKSQELTPELFEDDSYLSEFKEAYEGIEASVLVFHNPSVAVPIKNLMQSEIFATLNVIADERKKASKTGNTLTDIIKSAKARLTQSS